MKEQTRLNQFYEQVLILQDDAFRFALSILRSRVDTEDAIHNAILRAHDHLYQLKHMDKFRAWYFKIIRNECLAMIKKRKRLEEYNDTSPRSSREAMEIETDIDIRSAIWKLTQAHRTVLILYYSLGYSVKEIAEILEVPTGTVKSRLARARDDMKSLLEGDTHEF